MFYILSYILSYIIIYRIICLHALAEKNLSSSWAMWSWSYFSARWNSVFLIFSRMDRRYLKRICLPCQQMQQHSTHFFFLFAFLESESASWPLQGSQFSDSFGLASLHWVACFSLHLPVFFSPYLKFLLIVISSSPSLARGENVLLFFSSAGILKANIQFLLW